MTSVLRKLCCCGESEDDFGGPYERLSEDGAVGVVRVRPGNTNGIPNNGYDAPDSLPTAVLPPSLPVTEEDMIDQLINDMQQDMIDINHSDGLNLPTGDYMRRYNDYVEQVRLHDDKEERDNGGTRVAAPPRTRGLSGRNAPLLDETGSRLHERVRITELSNEKFQEFSEIAARISKAVQDISVQSKKDLVIHGL